MSETSRRGYLELGDPVGWDETLEHVLEEKQIFIEKTFFFDMKNIFFQKYFLDLKKFQNPCYEILGFPQNEQVHFVGNPKFHNSEILVPPESREKSIFPRFI